MAHLLNLGVESGIVRPASVREGDYKSGEFARAFGFRSSGTLWYHRKRGPLPRTLDELEAFAARSQPRTIGNAARARLERAAQRERDRAAAAAILLQAESAKRPQRNYSMRQAALARIAAGEVPAPPFEDKRRRKRK